MDQSSSPASAVRPFEVTHRSVLAISMPMTLAFLTTPLLGVTDMTVVGQFGDAALLGGLAAGVIVFDVVFTTFNFLRSGTTGLVAQAFGGGDTTEEQAVFWRAFLIAMVLGVLLALATPLVIAGGMLFIDPEPRVADAMRTYIAIRMLAAPLTLVNYAVLGYALGRGEGALGLLLQVALNGTNIALSIYWGLFLGWGIEGVAWGTVAGELTGAALGMAVVVWRFRRSPRIALGRIFDMGSVSRMIAMNSDIVIRSFSLLAAFALFTRQGAQFGTVTLAANAVLMNFFLVSSYFLDGFATAAEQLAGRAVGAGYRPAFDKAVRLTAGWGFALAFIAAALFLAFGEEFVAFMTTAEEVRELAGRYLPFAALTAASGVLAFQMDGVFIGATWSRDMRNMMLLSLGIYLASVAALTASFGNTGLWIALHIFLIMRGVSLLAVLPSRRRATFRQS